MRRLSSTYRMMAYVYGGLGLIAYFGEMTSDVYVALFVVIAFIFSITAEVLKEFGR